MAPPVKRTYGMRNWTVTTVSDDSSSCRYGLRRRKPLETVVESMSASNIVDSGNEVLPSPNDTFDRLYKSPMKQQVTMQPLSFWARKNAELECREVKSKGKDLYEFSSPDESPVMKKSRRRPKPRKKKENRNPLDLFIKKATKSIPQRAERSSDKKIVNEGRLIKERILLKKVEHRLEQSVITFQKKPPIFGLSSTPGLGQRGNIVMPSSFDFFSPIARDATLTPKRTKLLRSLQNEIDISSIIAAESPVRDWQSPTTVTEPLRNGAAEDQCQVFSPQESTRRTSVVSLRNCETPESISQHGADHQLSDRRNESSPSIDDWETSLEERIGSPALVTPQREETSADEEETSHNGDELEETSHDDDELAENWTNGSPFIGFSSCDLTSRCIEGGQSVCSPFDGSGSLPRRPRMDTETSCFIGFSSCDIVSAEGAALLPSSISRDACKEKKSQVEIETLKGLSETCDLDEEFLKGTGHVTVRRGGWGSSKNRSNNGSEASLNQSLGTSVSGSACVERKTDESQNATRYVTIMRGGWGSSKNRSNNGSEASENQPLGTSVSVNASVERKTDESPNVTRYVTITRGGWASSKNRSDHGSEVSKNQSLRASATGSVCVERKADDSRNVTRMKTRSLKREETDSTLTSSFPLPEASVGSPTLADEEVLKIDPIVSTGGISTKPVIRSETIATTCCRAVDDDREPPEISPYFSSMAQSNVVTETSSSSCVLNSSAETDKLTTPPQAIQADLEDPSRYCVIPESPVCRTSSEEEDEEQLRGLPCLNKTLLGLSNAVLMGGKTHKRARGVLRQLQSGRLTLHDASLLPIAPPGRGRAYESLVETVLGMQPGVEESLLINDTASRTLEISTMPRRPRTRSVTARKSFRFLNVSKRLERVTMAPAFTVSTSRRTQMPLPTLSSTLLPGPDALEKGNKTVHWRDSVTGGSRTSCADIFTPDLTHRQSCLPGDSYMRKSRGADRSCAGDGESTVVQTAKDSVLDRCNQAEPLVFRQIFNESRLPGCKKIGEGVYGEVFMYESERNGPTVLKVIPIEGELLVNDEPQKKFSEILSEIVISMELSDLRHGVGQRCAGFAEVRRVWCVVGEYPEHLQDLWNEYDARKGSENDSPAMFAEDQLYIVLELAHGGQDLEAFVFRNAAQSVAAFRQAALSLAVAERALQFEHRDFHWGNVLVSKTTEKAVTYVLDGKEHKLPTEGVQVAIIDFTLSRMTFEGCSVFNDLSVDPGLFTSEGDYQFEIYRMMKEETNNDWEQFRPRTNVFWLHYTLDKMMTMVRYSRIKSQVHTAALQKLAKWKEAALMYGSTYDFSTLLV